MRATFRFLTTIAIAGWIAFHTANAVYFTRLLTSSETCGASQYGMLGIAFSIPKACNKDVLGLDFSTGVLRGAGYIVRYFAGQSHFEVAPGTETKPLSLFRRSDVTIHDTAQATEFVDTVVPRLLEARSKLTDLGVEVVMVPLPPKTGIERSRLPATLPPPYPFDSLPRQKKPEQDPAIAYQELIRRDTRHAVDLYTKFRHSFETTPERAIYIPWGYHWTSYGIALTAEAVLEKLRDWGWPVTEIRVNRLHEEKAFTPEKLLNTYLLPSAFLNQRPEFSWRERYYDVTARVSSQIPRGRLVVIADSQGQILQAEGRSLGHVLSRALNRKLEDLSEPGFGGVGTLVHSSQNGFVFRPGDLVVFQFQVPSHFTAEQAAELKWKIEPSQDAS